MLRQLFLLLLLIGIGAVVLAPVLIFIGPAPMPGDFIVEWHQRSLNVPVIYSLCASAGLGLLYWIMKR